jgi:outer membrane protein assembly factor BamB
MLGVGLTGCSSFDDEVDPDEIPELTEIQAQFEPDIKWQEQVGDGVDHHFSRLTPAIHDGVVYAGSREGVISAFNLTDGKELWSVDLRTESADDGWFADKLSQRISGGITYAYDKLFVGTEHGQVIALNKDSGEVLWTKKVKGEVITPPGYGDGLIIVNTGAGYLMALHPDDGDLRWEYEQEVPPLTLRGISSPVVANGGVIFGSANGKLSVLISQSGLEAWKQSVATAVGASELERLVDVDTRPVVTVDTIFSLAYNGNLIAVDLQSGQIKWKKEYSAYSDLVLSGLTLYLTDVSGHIYAVDSRDGSLLWKQTDLERRGITGAYVDENHVIVGDVEGYLHWLNKDDGTIVSRIELDSTGFYVSAVGKGKQIIVQTRDGELTAIQTP